MFQSSKKSNISIPATRIRSSSSTQFKMAHCRQPDVDTFEPNLMDSTIVSFVTGLWSVGGTATGVGTFVSDRWSFNFRSTNMFPQLNPLNSFTWLNVSTSVFVCSVTASTAILGPAWCKLLVVYWPSSAPAPPSRSDNRQNICSNPTIFCT